MEPAAPVAPRRIPHRPADPQRRRHQDLPHAGLPDRRPRHERDPLLLRLRRTRAGEGIRRKLPYRIRSHARAGLRRHAHVQPRHLAAEPLRPQYARTVEDGAHALPDAARRTDPLLRRGDRDAQPGRRPRQGGQLHEPQPQQLPHADAVGRLAQRRLLDRRRLTALPADRSFARTPHRRGRGARPAVDSQLRQGTHRSAPPDTGARHAGRMALRERHRATLPHGLRPRAGRAEIPRRPQPVEAECDGAFRLGRRRSRSGLRHGRRREIHLEKRVVHLEDETLLGGHPENNRIKPDNDRFRQAERRAERSSDYAEARKRRMRFNLITLTL